MSSRNGKTFRVGIDYHVEVAGHYYSVPHRFARAEVEARLTVRTVEIFLKGERIAAYVRAGGNHKRTTSWSPATPCKPAARPRWGGPLWPPFTVALSLWPEELALWPEELALGSEELAPGSEELANF